jgi:hypothetical protein
MKTNEKNGANKKTHVSNFFLIKNLVKKSPKISYRQFKIQ